MSRQREVLRASSREAKKSGSRRGVGSSSEDGQAQPERPRPHTCTYCQKTFIRTEHLIRHVASHENRKPFKCHPCGASFGRTDVLRRHQKKCPGKPAQNPSPRLEHGENRNAADCAVQNSTGNEPQGASGDILMTETNCRTDDQDNERMMGYVVENTDGLQSHADVLDALNLTASRPSGSSGDSIIVVHQSGDEATPESELSTPQSSEDQDSTTSKAPRLPNPNTIATDHVEARTQSDQAAALESIESTIAKNNPRSGTEHTNLDDFLMFGDSFVPGLNPGDIDIGSVTDLLFDFNPNDMMLPVPLPKDICILSDSSRHAAPDSSFCNGPENLPQYQNFRYTPRTIRCSDDDVSAVSNAFAKTHVITATSDSVHLSLSQISRWINAYFDYFDIHTPIVHQPTFMLSTTPASLLLGMLAIGGCIVSERGPASKAYEASCHLLAQYEQDLLQSSFSELWPIQTALLCIQFGAFSDNPRYARQAQRQFSLVTDVGGFLILGEALSDTTILFRLASWTCILNAAISLLDQESTCIAAPQVTAEMIVPSNDSLWRAPSAEAWAQNKEWQSYRPVNLVETSRRVFIGEFPTVTISSFGLLTLIGALVANICARERYSPEMAPILDREYCTKMERSLQGWENLWRSHPHAEHVTDRRNDPLMADCLDLLSSAYHHLYMGQELQILKRIAKEPGCHLQAPSLPTNTKFLVVIKYATTAWLADTKTGIAHMQRKAALEFGGLGPMAAYETALIILWWLSLRQNLTSPNPGYTPVDEKEGLENINQIFKDIVQELDEQGIPGDGDSSDMASRALFHYQVMLEQWVWPSTLDA
ncbi:hypothetical protein BDP55DRAFT_636332 [Colletotrichum godetiae]|uniref:C2H2-type domain-containing protein n=1 Tax=Colletotrichum godetiae TaxID=1209918 RepID=A0AAJ0ER45_9PEZI|nr:uncharacterized protein BDP55DRAFT_636332 [Colletotrichum godetiae]KAK1660182.1 hypothetical protein BDP55DRAFT_636332 [Colletotrichum godetiae]